MQHIHVDNSLCTGCQACQLVCSMKEFGEFNLRRSSIRVRMEGMFPGDVNVCRQCAHAPCVGVCPAGALRVDEQRVSLDRTKCTGCGLCAEECPFEAIYIDPFDGLALKCDLCGGEFSCVKYCQKNAIKITKD